ncbi:hypothetical protein BJ138DRAFT_1020254 [Hygrophoropsis aurantiaca]|uniref:Uncharacterized protein n=1 Tax=Hygrophoropsis aurantiaca TaxID=72124 RepID=A0ACB7ZSM0_9AGAM|nr:hypothetical protein BJ138DRAFT_1020254 [Hygrophoropsis aurantiaca]
MNSWIADVQEAAFQLKEVGYAADDKDKILVLMQGLPPSYKPFIISLNAALSTSIPNPNDPTATLEPSLSLEVVKACLINEEAHQLANTKDKSHNDVAMSATAHFTPGAHPCGTTPLVHITCFMCGQKGHYQINCPEKNRSANVAGVDSSANKNYTF